MNFSERKRLEHLPPEWVSTEARYFVTTCARSRGVNSFCHPEIGRTILDSISYRHDKKVWFCHLAVLMPDHIHLILSFPSELPSLGLIVGKWKHFLAHQHAIEWQENFHDHRIRPVEKYGEIVQYVRDNPVRAGLAGKAADWPYIFVAPREL